MAIFNTPFLLNPENYSKQHPIAVIDRALVMAPPAAKGANLSGSGYLKVPKADRVSYCQISDSGGGVSNSAVDANTGGRAAIINDVVPAGANATDWFPVYYLPWQSNLTFRITLKPGVGGGTDPDIFFTSALNGCSVFVEGTPQIPTVCHLNDAANGGGPSPTGQNLATNTAYWTPLKNNMEGRFQNATSPKAILNTPGGQVVQAAKAVHSMDYMDVTQHYYQGLRLGGIMSVIKEQGLTQSAQPGERVAEMKYMTNIYQPYGTVFGWKQGGAWTFYFQKRGFIAYQYRKTYAAKSRYKPGLSEMVWVKRHVKYESREFWPNGAGQVVAKANRALV